MRWVAVMAHHPEEGSEVFLFPPEYFCWLRNQPFVIPGFLGAGMDYHGDLDMALPPGKHWDD